MNTPQLNIMSNISEFLSVNLTNQFNSNLLDFLFISREDNLTLTYCQIFKINFQNFYSGHTSKFFKRFSIDSMESYTMQTDVGYTFGEMTQMLITIYEKEQIFFEKLRNWMSSKDHCKHSKPIIKFKIEAMINQNPSITDTIISENILKITEVLRYYIRRNILKFKENYMLLESNCIAKRDKEILIKLRLFEKFTDILKDFLKDEILRKIEEFSSEYQKSILNDIIILFNDLYFNWALVNLNDNSSSFKEEMIEFIKKCYIRNQAQKFFDLVTNFPESQPALLDIKFSLSSIEQSEFINGIKAQISKRLLTPGIATPLIIEIFIRIIKMMKIIDPSSYLLEVISTPIKSYLKQRKDTMRWIITTILSEDDTSIKEDLGKQYIKSNASAFNKEKDLADYDCISSDEDEAAAESWNPLPISNNIQAHSFNNISTKSKFSDIISTLVNIFGSPEKFVEQYKRMLAERSVSDTNFSLENEIKNLELLKIKFGENIFQGCEVIIKDVKDSLKINSTIKSSKSRQNVNKSEKENFEFNCLIINKFFWPFKDNSIFSLEVENTSNTLSMMNNSNISSNSKFYNNFITAVNNRFDNFKKEFSTIKLSRTLNYFSNIGYVDLTLSFENGDFLFRVSPLAALIINLFDESNENNFKHYTVDYITDKLNSNLNDVKKKINFWISKGVLTEYSNSLDSGDEYYFYPSKILKILDSSSNVIIEEDIFLFEYVENENMLNMENAISSIIKNSGPRNFEQLFKNLIISYQVTISEVKLMEILGKMILEQKIFKEGEMYKLIVPTY